MTETNVSAWPTTTLCHNRWKVTCAYGSVAPLEPALGPALQLFRIKSERHKLSAPFSRRIAEPLDADAAGQATFHGCFHKIGAEEGERDGHVDLPNAAFLASAELCDRGHST